MTSRIPDGAPRRPLVQRTIPKPGERIIIGHRVVRITERGGGVDLHPVPRAVCQAEEYRRIITLGTAARAVIVAGYAALFLFVAAVTVLALTGVLR